LIFLLVSMGNIQTFLETPSENEFTMNYTYLGWAALVVYFIGFL